LSPADRRSPLQRSKNQAPLVVFFGANRNGRQSVFCLLGGGWDAAILKARIAFGVLEQEALAPPENALERRYALRAVKQPKCARILERAATTTVASEAAGVRELGRLW
jgi:putative restriction endonuclease